MIKQQIKKEVLKNFEELRTNSYEEPLIISDEEAEDIKSFFSSQLDYVFEKAQEEERKRIAHKLETLMEDKHAEMLGDSLELLYGERECKICGTNPEKQRQLIIQTIKNK